MAINLNMDMGSLVKGLMSKSSDGSFANNKSTLALAPYKFSIIIFIIIIAISAIYISAIYIPIKETNRKKTEALAKMVEMKNQLPVLDGQIVSLKKKLDKSKEQYLESLSRFGNSGDLGSLYQTVSTLSAKYGLVVLNIKEVAPAEDTKAKPKAKTPTVTPVNKYESPEGNKDSKSAPIAASTKPAAPAKPKIDVKEIHVEVELKGYYGEYIKFKEDIALAETLLKVNSESIMVKDEKTDHGSIYVKLNLSTYAIDKKPFQGIIAENENEKTN